MCYDFYFSIVLCICCILIGVVFIVSSAAKDSNRGGYIGLGAIILGVFLGWFYYPPFFSAYNHMLININRTYRTDFRISSPVAQKLYDCGMQFEFGRNQSMLSQAVIQGGIPSSQEEFLLLKLSPVAVICVRNVAKNDELFRRQIYGL